MRGQCRDSMHYRAEYEAQRRATKRLESLLATATAQVAEAGRPDWVFPEMVDDDAQLCLVSFADDHDTTAKVIRRKDSQFVTMQDVREAFPTPPTPERKSVEPLVIRCDGSDQQGYIAVITPADAKRIVALAGRAE